LPFLLMGALTGWCLYLIGKALGGPAAGFWTALLYTLSPFFTLFAGTFILPDGPLNLFLALAAFFLIRGVNHAEGGTGPWLVAGGAMALALASKYQAIFLLLAAFAFMVAVPRARRLLSRPGPYVAALIALAGLGPALIWNIQHDWASLAFHAGRVGQGLQALGFLVSLAGQAIYLLPWTLAAAIAGLSSAWNRSADWREPFLALAAIGPVIVFNLLYLMSASSLPHWTMPGWLLALPLAARWIVRTGGRIKVTAWLSASLALPLWLLIIAVAIHARTGWLTANQSQLPAWDNTGEIFDWSPLAPALADRNLLSGADFLAVTNWIDGGRLSTALGGELPVAVLEGDPHHFAYMRGADPHGLGLVLVAARVTDLAGQAAAVARLEERFGAAIERADTIVLPRGSRPYMAVSVLLLTLE
jgi:4-amino-4-deoxy-L-arabinose transferase-like glycosyltransferase